MTFQRALFITFLFFTACSTTPKPESMRYLSSDEYAAIKSNFGEPPAPGSAEQAADENELLRRQSERTKADCARAETEVRANLSHFYGAPGSELTVSEIEALKPFFKNVDDEAKDFIHRLKTDFPRRRPFTYIKGLNPCITREDTLSYPSGHATLSELQALVLSEIFPKRADVFEKRAQQIATDRVLGGVHHPTDVAAGRSVAHALFDDMKKSPRFMADLEEIKANLTAPTPPVPVH